MGYQKTRRRFIAETAGQVALGSAIAARFVPRSAQASAVSDESTWQKVREAFAFHEAKVPMNAANLCPSPEKVALRVAELTRDIDRDCSFNNRAQFGQLLETARQKVADHLGVSADEIALVRNTSEANNVINNGLPLEAGDEVVVWDQNHPTNNVAWDVRAARFGLSIKRVQTPQIPESAEQLAAVFTNSLTDKTRVLAITHVSNVSGIRLPVSEICRAAHQRGIHVHVDGAQTWGALNVNLRQLGCDSYSASAHKWFVGPKEVGLLYVRADRIPRIWPNVVAPGWGPDADTDHRGARKFESLGQRDDAALSAVGDTVDFHREIGPQRIEQRVLELAKSLKQGLREAGFQLVTPADPKLSAGVCIVSLPPEARSRAANQLYERAGIAGAPTGGLRLCPHIYNTRAHIDRAIQGMKAIREELSV